jgi:hypothetical protein
VSKLPRSRLPATPRAVRRLGLPVLLTGLVGLAAALPASAPADAQPATAASQPATTTPVNVSALSPQAVQELLSQIPVGGAGIPAGDLEVPQLAKVIAELPGIDALQGVGGLGGTAGLEAALRESLGKLLGNGNLSLGQLLSSQELTGELVKTLEATTHLPVAPLIEALLLRSPQAVLSEGLGSVDLSELLAKLFGGSANPAPLIGQLLEGLEPATLGGLVGSVPTGAPAQDVNLAELAATLAKTPQQLAEALGRTLATLPETADGATQLLGDGSEIALLDGFGGLNLGLVERTTEGAGVVGGAGSTGSTGSTGATTTGATGGTPASIVITMPGNPAASPTAGSASASKAAGKVEILSHKMKGETATLVVEVPSAGRLTISASGFKKVTLQAAKAERMTVHSTLTKARAASLRKRRGRETKIKMTGTFVPVSGHSSSASATVSAR